MCIRDRQGFKQVEGSQTRRYLFGDDIVSGRTPRSPKGWFRLRGVSRNNLHDLDVDFPLGVFTSVTGVSGSGKSTLVSQALVELAGERLGHRAAEDGDEVDDLEQPPMAATTGRIVDGMQHLKRIVVVDQKPIGRTPRSNLAT